jgi:hypothetical protein
MQKPKILLLISFLLFAAACSPRDYLRRRLAADLISASDAFKTPQQFWLRTGVVSNRDYLSPEYLVLERRGWISASSAPCPPNIAPPPCWAVALTPNGVNMFRDLVPPDAAASQYFGVDVARRQLLDVTGISKHDNEAEVDFRWKWIPLNAVGTALYNEAVEYNSAVAFRNYDDGWRLMESSPAKSSQGMDDALKNAQPAQ